MTNKKIGHSKSKLSHSLCYLVIATLTSFKIFSNFDGVSKEMGRYPFDKTLIALEYYFSSSMNLLYIFTYFSHTVVKNSTKFMA